MAPTTTQSVTPAQALALLPKLRDADSDLRYMSLNDLYTCLNTSSFSSDYHTSAKIIDGIILTLDDPNGEVQSQAIRCLGALVLKLPLGMLPAFVHRVSEMKATQSVDTSITATALRTIITAFPPPVANMEPSQKTQDAYSAISKVLIPRLLGYVVVPQGLENQPAPPPGMLELNADKGANSDGLDILNEVIRCFGPMLDDREKHALQKAILDILNDDRTSSIVKKKAVIAISLLAVNVPDRMLTGLVSNISDAFQNQALSLSKRRVLITVVGSLSKSTPRRLGPHLKTLAPYVLAALEEKEFAKYEEDAAEDGVTNPDVEEVREAALVALEGFMSSCSNAMRPFTNEAISASLRYVAYDPLSVNDEDDEAMGGTLGDHDGDEAETNGYQEEEEDFEEEGALSDDDDTSWKIRRCAAKNLYAIISTRSNGDLLENGILYGQIAPILIKRFNEREENVRIEILNILASLVKKTGEDLSLARPPFVQQIDLTPGISQRSRKRRRVNSNVDSFDTVTAFSSTVGLQSPTVSPPPVSGPRADLARLSPAIVRGVAKLLKTSSIATKEAAIPLLRDVVLVHSGGLSDAFGRVVESLVDAVKGTPVFGTGSKSTSAGASVASTGSKMRIEAMQLVSAVCDTHSSSVISPYIDNLLPGIVAAVSEKYYKVAVEGLLTLESIIKVLTPPRSAASELQRGRYLDIIYDSVLARSTATDADLAIRQQAIQVLGVLLARTSKTKLLTVEKRSKAFAVLLDRLKNETTRHSVVKAVDLITASAAEKGDLQAMWVKAAALELGAQLRKADRSLRGASLSAFRTLVSNQVALNNLDDKTISSLVEMLLPLLGSNELSLIGLAMTCLNKLVEKSPNTVVDAKLVVALCEVIVTPLGGAVFDALLALIRTIGEKGAGQPLMAAFLQEVGVRGDPSIVGKAIGTLLIAGGETVGVNIDAFMTELEVTRDSPRKCLALYILGEAGLHLGVASPLRPELFSAHFSASSESVPRAAAVALGRAGAGNINTFLPVILSNINRTGNLQYLSLHSIKEILQLAGTKRPDISPYTKEIWDRLLEASQQEENKIVGAECIGRITIIEPRTYLPLLQEDLKSSTPTVRGMAIQATRFTFADSDEIFDENLRPVLVSMLGIMLNDPNIENRRLALGTLNSAIHNKPDLILPHLGSLIPLVMKDTKIDPDLIRQVQMGPFKHQVDDGLELRKGSYETLYSFVESAYSRINHHDLFDRVIAGLEDEHEIKMLCNLMVTKLIVLDPEETLRRLDSIADKYRIVLSFKPKENSVKQELEKAAEASKAALRVTMLLHNNFPQAPGASANAQGQVWKAYWEWASKEFKTSLMTIENEIKNHAA